jgi:hypothetical protein
MQLYPEAHLCRILSVHRTPTRLALLPRIAMTSKLKPEQQVKELAKKKSNKACCDCGRSGPQQNVNTTLWTFICTQCAGIQSVPAHGNRSVLHGHDALG